MALAVLKNTDPLGDHWLPIDEAAALVGQSVRHWRRIALDRAASLSSGHRLAVQAPPRMGIGKPVWWVHRSIDPRLYRAVAGSEAQVRESLMTRYPKHLVERAYRKAHWLKCWRRACSTVRPAGLTDRDLAARVVAEAKQEEGDDFKIGVRSLQIWHTAYNTIGPAGRILGVDALVPKYGSGDGSGGSDDGSGTADGGRSTEAVEYFYELYHTQARQSVKICHQATLRRAGRCGWSWPASVDATRKWLDRYDDKSLTCMLREGRDRWQRRYMPYIQIDYRTIDPGQMYVADHHQCDFWITYGKKQIRPWLSAVQDLRSRCIVGWSLGPAPHQDAIIACLRMAFRDWAIPQQMRIDNGKDYTSKLITGVTKRDRDRLRRTLGTDWRGMVRRGEHLVDCVDPRFSGIVAELGVELIYARPYAPYAKGTLERWFGTFEEQCGKTFVSYCGNSAINRPDFLNDLRRGYTRQQRRALRKTHGPREWLKVAWLKAAQRADIPSLADATATVETYLELYHRTVHSADDMDRKSPLDMWQTASVYRRAVEGELLLLMQARGIYKVGPNGVTVSAAGMRIPYGAGHPALARLSGRGVFITLDPDDFSCCHAFTADRDHRRFIATLTSNQGIPPNTTQEQLREAMATTGRRQKIAKQADRSAVKRHRSAVHEVAIERAEQLAESRRTGTDDHVIAANIAVVRTGFEGVSTPPKSDAPKITEAQCEARAEAEAAMSYGMVSPGHAEREHVSDDLLRSAVFGVQEGSLVTDDDQDDQGKDAGRTSLDLLRMVAGEYRHEQRNRE